MRALPRCAKRRRRRRPSSPRPSSGRRRRATRWTTSRNGSPARRGPSPGRTGSFRRLPGRWRGPNPKCTPSRRSVRARSGGWSGQRPWRSGRRGKAWDWFPWRRAGGGCGTSRTRGPLRGRRGRMGALASRSERQAREAERQRPRAERKEGPSRFSGVPGGLVAPVRGKVVGPFGTYRDPVFHVDVENHGAEIEAPSGSPIRSIGKGNVVFSGTVSGFGKVLIIQHGTGLFSVYGKAESFLVAQGQVVAPGQNIGRLPESPGGKSVLYLELRAAGTAIDPTAVLPLSR